MNFTVEETVKNVYLLKFKSQTDMCLTFLRFQEFYESPKYRGKVFSLKEFKPWYAKEFGDGKFTYCSDWGGFNFPGWIIKAFEHGLFNPLSKMEQEVLNALCDIPEPFYVIGAKEGEKGVIDHEVAHGLWYTQPGYRKDALKIVNRTDMEPLGKVLLDIGYCKEVLVDEYQAYLVNGLAPGRVGDMLTRNYILSLEKPRAKMRDVFRKWAYGE